MISRVRIQIIQWEGLERGYSMLPGDEGLNSYTLV